MIQTYAVETIIYHKYNQNSTIYNIKLYLFKKYLPIPLRATYLVNLLRTSALYLHL